MEHSNQFLFPLTSLQIGDLQSYGSKLHLHVNHLKDKLVFFVDNAPWMDSTRHSKPVELWQFMVIQLRNSPFANRRKDINLEKNVFTRAVSQILHGCVTFEIEWSYVRGINYLNELQTDTSVALEVKILLKRQFHDFNKALNFYGVNSVKDLSSSSMERNSLICDVISGTDMHDMDGGDFTMNTNRVLLDASPYLSSHCKNNSIATVTEPDLDAEAKLPGKSIRSHSLHGSFSCEEDDSPCSANEYDAPTVYKDILLLFRFKDPMLPLQLKRTITSDQKLLKMLESGLPTWVMIMQSYPFVSKLYWPWMRPLVRATYVVVSIITAIIGLYDIYKNLPVFKATAARLCGPLFEWIEDLEMVSRIQYLGTMFFLQNFERVFRPLLSVFTALKRVLAIMTKPMVESLEEFAELIWWPVWSILFYSVWECINMIYMTSASVLKYVAKTLQLMVWPFIILMAAIQKFCTDLVQLIAWPFMVCLAMIQKLVTLLLCPIIFAMWSLVMSPFRLTRLLYEFFAATILNICKLVQNLWTLFTSLSYTTGPQGVKAAKASGSSLRILWNNIFFQAFRAVRNILNVLMAFFSSCNRHRFSMYNNIKTLIFQLECMEKCAHVRVEKLYHALGALFLGNRGGPDDDESNCGGNSNKTKSKCSELRFLSRRNVAAPCSLRSLHPSMMLKKIIKSSAKLAT